MTALYFHDIVHPVIVCSRCCFYTNICLQVFYCLQSRNRETNALVLLLS